MSNGKVSTPAGGYVGTGIRTDGQIKDPIPVSYAPDPLASGQQGPPVHTTDPAPVPEPEQIRPYRA
jgi:hypothetical protein